MTVLVPIEDNGKRPTAKGWAEPGYQPPEDHTGNWGLRTDNIVVIDCDTAEAVAFWLESGHESWAVVRTRRGAHFYYSLPEGEVFRPGPLTAGIDIKTGPGAYVLIPPSVIDGNKYEWVGSAWTGDPAKLPAAPVRWIRELLPSKPEELDPSSGWDMIPEGRRNVTLTALAGTLRKQGAGPAAIAATLATMNAHRCDPPVELHELLTIVRSVLRYEADPTEPGGDIEILIEGETEEAEERPLVVWAAAMEVPPPPRWIMPPFLPAGRLVLVDGNEGIGKGLFATWVATQLASGGFLGTPAGTVLWGSTEDDPEEDILRRLMAAGYDGGRHKGIGFLNGEAMSWRFPTEIGKLAQVVREAEARVLILDPGRSFLGSPQGMSHAEFSYNNEAHVRPGLEALNLLARRLDVTVLFIHHWNKNLSSSIRIRSGGSAAFAQTVRHRVTLDYLSGAHAIAVEKSNLTSRENTVYTYELEPVDEFSTARFVLGNQEPAVDLDAWEEMHRDGGRLNQGEETSLNVALVLDAAAAELTAGGRFWTREQLQSRFGFSQRLAKAVIDDLRRTAELTPGPKNTLVWSPR